jgi:hypothetical protein
MIILPLIKWSGSTQLERTNKRGNGLLRWAMNVRVNMTLRKRSVAWLIFPLVYLGLRCMINPAQVVPGSLMVVLGFCRDYGKMYLLAMRSSTSKAWLLGTRLCFALVAYIG